MPAKKKDAKKGKQQAAADEAKLSAAANAANATASNTPLQALTVRIKWRRWTFFVETTNKETTIHLKVKLLNMINPQRAQNQSVTQHAAMGGQAMLLPNNVDCIRLLVPKHRGKPMVHSATAASTTSQASATGGNDGLSVSSLTGARAGTKYAEATVMENERSLEDLQIHHDDIVFCVLAKDAAAQKWDEVDVPAFEPLSVDELRG